jgi:hypothetical protein
MIPMRGSREEYVEADAVEEPAGVEEPAAEVRALPQRHGGAELETWRGEVRNAALAAAGGLAAGAATVAAVNVVRGRAAKGSRGPLRRGRKRENIVASRSFLVDVHVLGR